jgi:hypothetical protein
MTQDQFAQVHTDAEIQAILASVRTIAMVGASADETKPSNQVLRFLHDAGYEVIPVNPRPDLTEILGLAVHPSLEAIGRPVDMVDVFRPSAEVPGIATAAVEIGARILWTQLGIHNEQAVDIALAGGLKVVTNRCPKLELLRASRESDPDRGTRRTDNGGFHHWACGLG